MKMMVDVGCILMSKTYLTDDYGNAVVKNGRQQYKITKTEVPIIKTEKVWKDEFYKANEQGLRPNLRIVMSALNYSGEENLIYNNEEYSVIRTDGNNYDEVILICERRTSNYG